MDLSWIKNHIRKLRYGPIGLVYAYQRIISPLTSPACRFYPSCSSYARLAMEKHGIMKGGAMSMVRISKCHPFHPGGYDPVD